MGWRRLPVWLAGAGVLASSAAVAGHRRRPYGKLSATSSRAVPIRSDRGDAVSAAPRLALMRASPGVRSGGDAASKRRLLPRRAGPNQDRLARHDETRGRFDASAKEKQPGREAGLLLRTRCAARSRTPAVPRALFGAGVAAADAAADRGGRAAAAAAGGGGVGRSAAAGGRRRGIAPRWRRAADRSRGR